MATWLHFGAPVDFRFQNSGTLLHIAVENSQLEIVKVLLKYNANVNAKDHLNYTPLHLAAIGNSKWNKEIICILLEKGAQINAKDNCGFRPIHVTLFRSQFENTIQLMKLGAKLDNLLKLDDEDVFGLTLLHWAVIEGQIDIVMKILEHNVEIDAEIGQNCNFECHIEGQPVRSLKAMTPLHLATLLGHPDIVSILLDMEAESYEINQDLETPLNLAMHVGEITLKLNNNRQIKKVIDAESNKIIVSKLLPVSDKEWRDIGKMTPLLRATSKGLVTTVTQLIDWGADLQAVDKNKNTALHLASINGNPEIVKILLENGAKINAVNSTNETPLILAIQKGYQDIVNKLLANGADFDVSKLMPKFDQGHNNCSLCFNPKNGIFAFQPCGHANACESCCVKLTFSEDAEMSKCPICRTTVTHFQRIYM